MIRQVTEGEVSETAGETVKAVKRPAGVNPLVGGIGRYFCLLAFERTAQLLLFPLALRAVHDCTLTCDAPLPAQALAAGAAVGAAVSVVKYPLDKEYMRKV